MRWDDWDETRGILHIRRSQVRGMVTPVKRKKSAPPQIPVMSAVADALHQHRERTQMADPSKPIAGWMFPSRTGTLRAPASLTRAFKRCTKLAGITGRFSPHGLRYTFTDILRLAAVDPIVRRQLTGHRTERMQANYSTVRLDEHRHALRQMEEYVKPKRNGGYFSVYPEHPHTEH